ncbi:hypothetical protein JXA40_00900 [bacterium]|nr:hypothetical protein [candidate division CSSED10-310 bacterium]
MSKDRKSSFRFQVSSPVQDPFMMIDFLNESCVLLFDCGVRVWGKVKVILKLKHLFITHAHIDHLIGFDHIIRALLGENTELNIYGPPGITRRIAHKLFAYDWDRAEDQHLTLRVHEMGDSGHFIRTHACREKFEVTDEEVRDGYDETAVETGSFSVKAVQVNHGGSPCLAYSFTELDRYRIRKDRLLDLGLHPGPWVGRFLESLDVPDRHWAETGPSGRRMDVAWLRERIVEVQKGQKIAYVTDTAHTPAVVDSISRIAKDADILICESTFLEEDRHLAEKYHHLTARQAAEIAVRANAGKLLLFHVSSRYFPRVDRVLDEARKVFLKTELTSSVSRSRRRFTNRYGANEKSPAADSARRDNQDSVSDTRYHRAQ